MRKKIKSDSSIKPIAKKASKYEGPLVLRLYMVKIPDKTLPFGTRAVGPFMAVDDNSALLAFAELAKTEPILQRRYLYCIGAYNIQTGNITALAHTLVKAKKGN